MVPSCLKGGPIFWEAVLYLILQLGVLLHPTLTEGAFVLLGSEIGYGGPGSSSWLHLTLLTYPRSTPYEVNSHRSKTAFDLNELQGNL